MPESCFFTQNLLSDFIEGILPAGRSDSLKTHLDKCRQCSKVYQELSHSIQLLQAIPLTSVHHEMGLRLGEAAEAGRPVFRVPRKMALWVFASLAIVGGLLTASLLFPDSIPLLAWFDQGREPKFVRYYPLLQGASEVLEEQSTWLNIKDNSGGSLWEEGGLSPEEFEKSFQLKSTREK